MPSPPETTVAKWRMWAWLPLLSVRVDEAQLRDLLAALGGASAAGGKLGSRARFDKRLWSTIDDAGWWAMVFKLLPSLPGSAAAADGVDVDDGEDEGSEADIGDDDASHGVCGRRGVSADVARGVDCRPEGAHPVGDAATNQKSLSSDFLSAATGGSATHSSRLHAPT